MSDKIKLVSTATNIHGKPTGSFYTTKKNKKKHPQKIERSKFDKRAHDPKTGKTGMHVVFKEASKI